MAANLAHESPAIDLRPTSRRLGEAVVRTLLGGAALVSVVTTAGIVISLLLPALDFFGEIHPLEFLTGTEWAPLFEPAHFGVLPLVVATLEVTASSLVVAVPIGIGAAVFLSEVASRRLRAALKPSLELLAAVPTVVFGYFALTSVTPLLRALGIEVEIFNLLSGGLVLGLMLVPTVASLSEDAMAAVPRTLRDGAYALGADRAQVTMRVVIPAAISGIVAAVVLGLSRAVGETMIVLIAVGQMAQLTFDPRQTVETLTAFIGATGNGDLPTGSTEYKTIFAVGLLLFATTFVANAGANRLVRRYREAYH